MSLLEQMYTMGSRHTNSGGHFEQGDLKPGSNFIKYLLSTRLLDHENSKGRDENTSTPLKIAIQNKKGKWFNSYMKMTTSIPAYIGFLWDIWEEIPIGWFMYLINFMCRWRTLPGSGSFALIGTQTNDQKLWSIMSTVTAGSTRYYESPQKINS